MWASGPVAEAAERHGAWIAAEVLAVDWQVNPDENPWTTIAMQARINPLACTLWSRCSMGLSRVCGRSASRSRTT